MKLLLIGATGFVGSALLEEARSRGHTITALARHPEKIAPAENVTAVGLDVNDIDALAAEMQDQDAVVSAFNGGWTNPEIYADHLKGSRAVNAAGKQARVPYLLVIGGAGSLYIAPGKQLIDTPEFPKEFKAGALAARELLDELRAETDLNWTFVSPPVNLAPGERTGQYELGADDVPMGADGPAGISVADLAVAILDDVEKRGHLHTRFTAWTRA